MATRKTTAKAVPLQARQWAGLYGQFLKRLKTLGCVFCSECYAYVLPEHAAHVAADKAVAS